MVLGAADRQIGGVLPKGVVLGAADRQEAFFPGRRHDKVPIQAEGGTGCCRLIMTKS